MARDNLLRIADDLTTLASRSDIQSKHMWLHMCDLAVHACHAVLTIIDSVDPLSGPASLLRDEWVKPHPCENDAQAVWFWRVMIVPCLVRNAGTTAHAGYLTDDEGRPLNPDGSRHQPVTEKDKAGRIARVYRDGEFVALTPWSDDGRVDGLDETSTLEMYRAHVRNWVEALRVLAEVPIPIPEAGELPPLTTKNICKIIGISTPTFAKAADDAGVKRPARGKHDRPFPENVVHAIGNSRKRLNAPPAEIEKWQGLADRMGTGRIGFPPRAKPK